MEEALGARRMGCEGTGRKHQGAHPAGRSVGANTAPLRGPQGEGPRGGEPRGPLEAGPTRGARANPKGKQKVKAQAASSGGGRVTPGQRPESSAGRAPGSGAGAARLRAGLQGWLGAGSSARSPWGGRRRGSARARVRLPGALLGGRGSETTGRPRSPGPPHSPAGAGQPPPDVPAPRPPPGRAPPPHHFRDALGTPEDPRLGGS